MMHGIAQLAGLQLHDTTIQALHIDFVGKRIEIEIIPLDDEESGKLIVLHFTGISALALGEMINGEDPELYSAEFSPLASGLYRGVFVTLLGASLPSWEFSFEFAGVSVRGGS